MTADQRSWRAAWPGFCATFTAVGIGRFSYTPLIPFLIAEGILSETEAAYLGAANLLGYLIGAGLAGRLAARLGMARSIRLCFIISVLSLTACLPQLGFWWFLPWRVLIGIASAILMVLAPSLLLVRTAAAERGRAGGLIYTGVGLGTAIGGLLVAPLAAHGTVFAWGALAVAAALAALASWRGWREGPALRQRSAAAPSAGRRRFDLPVVFLILAFAADGGGFVPHTIFWVDFIARELGFGATAGAFNWLLFGLGALSGPFLAGAVGDRIGLGIALIVFYAVKALAVALPTFSTAPAFLALSSFVVGALSPGITSLLAARVSALVEPAYQARNWAVATVLFSVAQAVSAYGMSFAFTQTGRYLPLYAVGGMIEALGMACCILAFATSRGR